MAEELKKAISPESAAIIRTLVTTRYALQKARIQTELRIQRVIADQFQQWFMRNHEKLGINKVLEVHPTHMLIEVNGKPLKVMLLTYASEAHYKKKKQLKDMDGIVVLVNDAPKLEKLRVFDASSLVPRLLTAPQIHEIHQHSDEFLYTGEEKVKELIEREMEPYREHGIVQWIRQQKGLGPILTAGLIAGIQDIARFDNPSKLDAYSGYHVILRCQNCGKRLFERPEQKANYLIRMQKFKERSKTASKGSTQWKKLKPEDALCHCETPEPKAEAPKRRRGEVADWSPFMRTLLWKISDSFLKRIHDPESLYGQILSKRRDFELSVHAERCNCKTPKGHSLARAKRYTVKQFMHHLWEYWRKIDGLPVRPPYAIEKLGHQTHYSPMPLKSDEDEEIEEDETEDEAD